MMSYKKNPIQMLDDMAKEMNLKPFYNLIYSEGYGCNTLFKYSVEVGEYSGFGSGRSKREAKHDAACTVLKIMDYNIDKTDPNLEETLKKIDELSPYSGTIKENIVGQLINLCEKYYLPRPVYNLLKSEKLKNGYFFMFECIVSNWSEIAFSEVKKQAKHIVSKQMIDRLQSVIGSFLTSIPEIEHQDRGDIIKAPSINRLKLGLKLSEYHKFLDADEFQNISLPTLDGLRDKDLEWIINNSSIEELLENILLELNFTREIKVFKNKVWKELKFQAENSDTNLDNENQSKEKDDKIKNSDNENVIDNTEMVYVILTIHNCFPLQVFIGGGSNYEDAIRNAILSAVMLYFYLSKPIKSLE